MRALYCVILLLPFFTCLAGAISFLRLPQKGTMQWLFIATTIIAAISFMTEAFCVHIVTKPELALIYKIVGRFTHPFIMALMILSIYSRYHQRPLPWYMSLWLVLPLLTGTVYSTIVSVAGFSEVAHNLGQQLTTGVYPEECYSDPLFISARRLESIHHYVILVGYSFSAIAYGFYVLFRTGYTRREGIAFHREGASMPPFHVLILTYIQVLVLVAIRAIVGAPFLYSHPWMNALLMLLAAICMQFVTLAGHCIDYEECTRRQLLELEPKESLDPEPETEELLSDDKNLIHIPNSGTALESIPLSPMSSLSTPDALPDEHAGQFAEEPQIACQERIREGLERLMAQDRAFRQCGLKIDDVARLICTNRLYISRYVNTIYGVNFNEYLNHLRIEYSKEYMRQFPHEVQDRIAEECGFVSAQSFSRKFKEIEGITPRTWVSQFVLSEKQK